MTLDQIIRAELARQGMTQQALADAMGVTRQAVYAWHAGTARPSLRRLPALSAALRVPVADLVGAIISTPAGGLVCDTGAPAEGGPAAGASNGGARDG